jgi:DNA-binding MarR family transcriptional regulator
MVAVIDRLESRGWVVRAPSPNDRRSYALELSPAGSALVEDLIPRVRAHEKAMAKDLNKQEQAILIDLLNRVARAG